MIVGNKEVSFQHRFVWENPRGDINVLRLVEIVTECTVLNGVGSYTGFAKCGKNDNFNKAIGRKIAFTRALKSIPRAERKELWEAYKQSHKYLTKRN